MLAQRRIETVQPVVYRKKKAAVKTGTKDFTKVVRKNRMICVVLAAGIMVLLLTMYIGAYAGVIEKGYSKDRLMTRLNDLKTENEELKLSLEELRQPDRIGGIVLNTGMKQAEEMTYLDINTPSRVAKKP